MTTIPPDQGLAYAEDAKQRVNTQGFEVVRSFVNSIPRQRLARIAARLPRINGFRLDHAADEQLKRLVRRLTTPDATDLMDWHVMGRLWLAYCTTRIAGELGTILIEADRSLGEPIRNPDVLENVRRELENVSKAGSVSRENLDLVIQLSPFPEVGALLSATRDAPTRETIEQAHKLDEAKRRLVDIEGRLAKLENRDDQISREALAHLQDLQSQVTDVRADLARVEGVTGPIQQSALEQRFTAISTEFDRLSQRLDYDSASLRQSTDAFRAEFTARHHALQNRLEEHLKALETSASAVEIGGRHTPTLPRTTSSIAVLHDNVPARSEAQLATSSELRLTIAQSMYVLGLTRDSSAEAALEIVAAIISGQLVSFRGSLSGITAATVRACFPGQWDTALVPIGIGDAITLTDWHRTSEKARNLLLAGVNHSAFEIYGQPIRQEVVRGQLASATSERLYLAVVTEGAGALPLIRSFVDLGPVVDTDSLDWRASGSSTATTSVNGQFHELRRGFDLVRSLGDAKSTLDEASDPFSGILTALGTQTITRALGALIETHSDDDEAAYWRSLFYSWVHPQLRAAKLSQSKAREVVSQSVFAGVLSTNRGRRLLGQLAAQ